MQHEIGGDDADDEGVGAVEHAAMPGNLLPTMYAKESESHSEAQTPMESRAPSMPGMASRSRTIADSM